MPSAPSQSAGPAPAPGTSQAGRVVAAALTTVVLWASSFPAARYSLTAYGPLPLSMLRAIVASVTLLGWGAVLRVPLPARRDLPVLAFYALVGIALATVTLYVGLVTVSAGAGSFLVGTIPIFSALLARFWLRERLSGLGWLGIAVSFGGIALIAFGEGRGLGINWGALWILASAACQSVYYVGQKPLLTRYTALQLTVYTIPGGTVLMAPLALLLPGAMAAAPWQATAAAVYLGALPIAVAFVLWSYALARAKAARVTSAMYAMPAIAITLAWLWLGEVPHPLSLLGGAAALVGVAIVTFWGR